jgi:Zn-dependent alcohol dehydrogenase
MNTSTAITYAAGMPLEVVMLDLDGPRAGEVLVELKATGVCHTDEFTRAGANPEGLFPVISGHEGAGLVVGVDAEVKSVWKGDQVIPRHSPEYRECESCTSHKTNLCTAIRATQGNGVIPHDTRRFSVGGVVGASSHWMLDLPELHGGAGDRGSEDPRRRAGGRQLRHWPYGNTQAAHGHVFARLHSPASHRYA